MREAVAAVAGRLVGVPRGVPHFVLRLPPRARRPLAVALGALAVLGSGYLLWLRDSSLVRIERVQIGGLTSRDAPRVREALATAAREMSTLHLSRRRLEEAVAGYPVVQGLRTSTDFPHGLRIEVVERRPVALVGNGAQRVPVAADGRLLRGLPETPRLPAIDQRGVPRGDRLAAGRARQLVGAASAAPPALLPRLASVRAGPRGLVAELRNGPEVVLGSVERLRAKWMAAAAVMADRSSRGAEYVDVRLPERPAAGGLPAPAPEPEAWERAGAAAARGGLQPPVAPPSAQPAGDPASAATADPQP